jgi:hypothetical protein
LVLFVEAGDIEFQNQVATQLMVFPRYNPGPADIMQSGSDFEEAPLRGTVSMEAAKPVEKRKRESRHLFVVCRIGIKGSRHFDDK